MTYDLGDKDTRSITLVTDPDPLLDHIYPLDINGQQPPLSLDQPPIVRRQSDTAGVLSTMFKQVRYICQYAMPPLRKPLAFQARTVISLDSQNS